MPDPDVDAMYAAGPIPQHLPVAETPGAELVVELMRSSKAAYVALDHGDVHLRSPDGSEFVHSGNDSLLQDEPDRSRPWRRPLPSQGRGARPTACARGSRSPR